MKDATKKTGKGKYQVFEQAYFDDKLRYASHDPNAVASSLKANGAYEQPPLMDAGFHLILPNKKIIRGGPRLDQWTDEHIHGA